MTHAISTLFENTSIRKPYMLLIILLSIIYRCAVSFHPYSGQGKPKLFGDYEAQRHWMEITYNLDAQDWYVNTTNNDLAYWGLDYPPLTAYHSYLMGYIANSINPKFVTLNESRGIESEEHKLFMRLSVIVSEIIIFYPATILLLKHLFKERETKITRPKHSNKIIDNNCDEYYELNLTEKDSLFTLLIVLINPTLVLIDHGHFQYNCISLGLMQLAIYFLLKSESIKLKWLTCASILFCMALNYKQMELYHALPFFFYLLGLSLFKSKSFNQGIFRLLVIGSTVLFSFVIMWLPFLKSSELILQVLNRLFPFSRGLFEDKVANFWCSISVLFKLREHFEISFLSKVSFLITFILNLPSGIDLLLRPTRQRFMLALVNSSLIFYLFSFQVHEKSILLVSVPACLLINHYPFIVSWFILITNFSMFPLYYKDGLTIAYLSTSFMFFILVLHYYYVDEEIRQKSFVPNLTLLHSLISSKISKKDTIQFFRQFKNVPLFTYLISLTGIVALSVCMISIKTPSHLPDLWTVAICVYSCAHFIGFSILFHLIQFTLKSDDLNTGVISRETDKLLFNFESRLTGETITIKKQKKHD